MKILQQTVRPSLHLQSGLYFLPQSEEEFLSGLTQEFPDDSVDRDDEDEDESEESEEEEEEEEEQERKESQHRGRRSQSLQSAVERRADVGSMVFTLHQEGQNSAFC